MAVCKNLFSCFSLAAFVAAAAMAASAQELTGTASARQASLDEIMTSVSTQAIDAGRLGCMFGEEPRKVTEGRRAGKAFLPDASDTCIALLARSARDGRLPDLYRTVLANLGGDADLADRLPRTIGNTVMTGDGYGKIDIGNGKATAVPAPLAFDAGFTVAYLKGDKRGANADPNQLKAVVEACLAVRSDPGTCFSAGYAEGGLALSSR